MLTRLRRALLAALCGCAATHCVAQTAYTLPDCPAPEDVVTVAAVAATDKNYGTSPWPVEVNGSVIKLVAYWSWNYFSAPPQAVRATIGRLPLGTYRLDVYAREYRAPDFPGPEELVASKSFTVSANPPTCAAETIVAVDPPLHTAEVNRPYETVPTLRALDAHGHPVSGVVINLQRVPAIGPPADFTSRPQQVTTGANGEARLTGLTANATPGMFQYQAWYWYAAELHSQYFVFSNRESAQPLPLVPVVEYFHYGLLHFFMTANADEMRALDARSATGWSRTGEAFLALAPDAAGTIANAVPVCRFYGRPEAGLDSHFFSASAAECADVEQRFGQSWMLETKNAFALFLPDTTTGACPPATMPIYRGYNNLPDANHRYATSAEGAVHPPAYRIGSPPWSLEGYGPGVVMCAPK